MSDGEGSWIVVLYFPNLNHKVVGRYYRRSEAEHYARKLKRMLGSQYQVEAVFDSQSEDLEFR